MNRIALLDVLEDMRDELQVNAGHSSIRLCPQVIKYPELFPGDSPGMRDRYMKTRYKAANLLRAHGVVSDLNAPQAVLHRWESELEFTGDLANINSVIEVVRHSLDRESRTGVSRVGFIRYVSHLVSFAAGVSAVSAIQRHSPWLWGLTAALVAGLSALLGFIPRWKGAMRTIVDCATVAGAVATIIALVWMILHTPHGG